MYISRVGWFELEMLNLLLIKEGHQYEHYVYQVDVDHSHVSRVYENLN